MGNFNVQKEFNRVIFDYAIPDISIAFTKLARDLSNGNFDPLFGEYEEIIKGTANRLKATLSMHIDSQADAYIRLLQVEKPRCNFGSSGKNQI